MHIFLSLPKSYFFFYFPATLCFSRDFTSQESASKIIARRRNISPLYPLHPSLALIHSFSSLCGIKFKTVIPCSVKNWPRSGIKRAKNMRFPSLCSEKSALSSETFAFLKLQYLFRVHVIFQFKHQQRRAAGFVLGNVVKT